MASSIGHFAKATRLGLAAASVALACAAPALADERALIIGVDDYISPEISDLRHAASDAQKFRTFIIEHMGIKPKNATLLTNQDATQAAFEAEVERILAETDPGDRVVIYFAGHGTRVPDLNGDETDTLDEVVLFADADPSTGRGMVLDDQMEAILARLADRDLMLVFDACHSGTITRSNDTTLPQGAQRRFVSLDTWFGDTETAHDVLRTRSGTVEGPLDGALSNRVVWSAALPAQSAWEDEHGGIFTRHFIKGASQGVADANQNGRTTNAELLDYLRQQTSAWCETVPLCAIEGFEPMFAGPREGFAATFGASLPGLAVASATETPTATPAAEHSPFVLPSAPYTDLAYLSDMFATANTAGLTLQLLAGDPAQPIAGNTLRLGEIVQFEVASARPGQLVLYDLNPNGELFQIFPSPLSRPGVTEIAAGAALSIPEALSANGRALQIRVTEPAGRGQLLAVLIEDRSLDVLDRILPQNLATAPIADGAALLLDMAASLKDGVGTPDGQRAIAWSGISIDYEIIP